MLTAARDSGQPQRARAAVAFRRTAAAAQASLSRPSALLAELERSRNSGRRPLRQLLPSVVRTALALDETALAASLADGIEPVTPLHQHALVASRAQLAEAAGDQRRAATLRRGRRALAEFGNVPERAYALLGQGRCLTALGQPEAQEPLREARELFASMGYQPALAETNALLERTTAAAS